MMELSLVIHFVYFTLLIRTLPLNIGDVKIFGHRGGIRGLVPESSVLSFSIGAQMNADYLECDIVSSKDGELIVMHDIVLDAMTDVAQHLEFANLTQTFNFSCREENINIPPQIYNCYRNITGHYVFNFTLQQLKTLKLRARGDQYFNSYNPLNDIYEILTFKEFLSLVNNLSLALNRTIGVTPELKSAWIMRDLGLEMEEKYMSILYDFGFVDRINDNYYQTKYFMKNNNNYHSNVSLPMVIVQSDSYSSLKIISDLSNNNYNTSMMQENVPLQFGVYTQDTMDWKLINWINTFSNGVNIPWLMLDEYYDIIEKNSNVTIDRTHFRLEDFVPGQYLNYPQQYIRNQYFKALSYKTQYGLDAIFSDNVENINSIIDMIYELSNTSSILYDSDIQIIDWNNVETALGIDCNNNDNYNWNLNGWFWFFLITNILWIIALMLFVFRKKRVFGFDHKTEFAQITDEQ